MRKKNIVIGAVAIWLILNSLSLVILFRDAEEHVERSAALVSAYVGTAGVNVGYSGPLNLLAKLVNSDDRFTLTEFSTLKGNRPYSSINLAPPSGFIFTQYGIGRLRVNADIAGYRSAIAVGVSDWAIVFSLLKSFLMLGAIVLALRIKTLSDAKKMRLRIAEERFDVANQVAHDIRSPLSAITLVAASISKLDADRGHLLKQSAERLDQIAADLLSSNRPRQFTNNFADILTSLIDEQRLTTPDVIFEVDVKEEGPIGLSEPVIGRSLSNLVKNAVEAGAAKVSISARRSDKTFIVKVSDTGKGMSNEILARAGRKYFSSKNHGNGLGLSFVKEEIEKVGGKIKVHSIKGLGSEIELLIPLKVV